MFNCSLPTGTFPFSPLLIELDKPNSGPEMCRPRRPISLLCASAKILEAAAYHRLIQRYEGRFCPDQYAYKRGRGAELRLVGLSDVVREPWAAGRCVYVAALDVDEAFDTAPHKLLVEPLEKWGVDSSVCRYAHAWLGARRFQVRLNAPQGARYSDYEGVSRGLPQGGVLPPFLWLAEFKSLRAGLRRRRELRSRGWGGDTPIFCDRLFADVAIVAIIHRSRATLAKEAVAESEDFGQELGEHGLGSASDKSENSFVEPELAMGSFLRGGPNANKKATTNIKEDDARLGMLTETSISHLEEWGSTDDAALSRPIWSTVSDCSGYLGSRGVV